MPSRTIKALHNFLIVLALGVVMLGAYTRLTDAGLGCPDWPGCYGQLVLPQKTHALHLAQQQFPNIPLEVSKAWTEMAHRYLAGTLVLLIMTLLICLHYSGLRDPLIRRLSWLILVLLFFQATLGMWTVTLKLLPLVVMGHLLGGMLIFFSLVYLRASISQIKPVNLARWRILFTVALMIVGLQIALGGWVSANYAGLACIGFPQCNATWLPHMDWREAFNLLSSTEVNYQGGVLNNPARVTIQMMHRFGAGITLSYLLSLSASLTYYSSNHVLRRFALLLGLLVILQCALGIANVLYLLPISVAVLHNGCAALLLANLAILRYITGRGYSR